MAEDSFIGDPTPETPALALMQLSIVQTYLLELSKAEGPNGSAMKASAYVEKAIEILQEYEDPKEH